MIATTLPPSTPPPSPPHPPTTITTKRVRWVFQTHKGCVWVTRKSTKGAFVVSIAPRRLVFNCDLELFLRSSPKHNLTSSYNGSPSCALVKKYMISEFAEALTPL
ncbi:hypothetical protein Tco_0058289 [Tanacetum coccineum]